MFISIVSLVHDQDVLIWPYGKPGACFTKDFLPTFQIWWKLCLAVIPLLANRPQQIFAHVTTAQLSCHVQNFAAVTVLESRWEWNEISIEFELRWKNREWNGALYVIHITVPIKFYWNGFQGSITNPKILYDVDTIECHYNVVQYNIIL